MTEKTLKTASECEKYLAVAWEAVAAAGAIIDENWHKPKQIDYKGAIDLVTSVDRESERCIVAALQRHFPEHSILAEEEAIIETSNSRYRWIIDPLDGTTNFAHSYPHFCISIALEHHHSLLVGLVYDPIRRECFRAIKGGGATLNNVPIQTSRLDDLDKALLATGFPYDRRDHADHYLAYFKAFMLRCQGIRRNGSAALDLCYVACGRLDGYWELKLKPWDTAAGALIAREAGGTLSGFSGEPYSIWGSETLASNGRIHSSMVEIARLIASE